MSADLELLSDYARNHAEESFAALVNRHLNLVFSAALRQVRSPQLAEEVAQSVFADLARQSASLAPDTILTAWLYQVTRRTAIDVVRREARRQLREQIAMEMNAINATAGDWTRVEPLLDEAMQALDDTDRAAVLLRYFENKSLREVGQTLGTSDDAAQKRVSRAVDRLREFFVKHGVTVGASGLAVVISAHAAQGAPAGLAGSISATVSLAGVSALRAAGGGVRPSRLKNRSRSARMKFGAGVAATALVALTTYLHFRSRDHGAPRLPADAPRTTLAADRPNRTAEPVVARAATVAEPEQEPDPRALLEAVARARGRIASGSLEFKVMVEHFAPGRPETNQLRITALFDGAKLRFDQYGREYRYAYSPDEAEAERIRRQADSLDREAAVRAGFLQGFASHHALAYDGAVLIDYWETDGKTEHVTIDDPSHGTGQFVFDPRCLGLCSSPSVSATVETCLGYNDAKSIRLLGQELVDGAPAWQVRVLAQSGTALEFWIDAASPERLLKQACGSDVVVSKYAGGDAGDPLPTEVTTMDYQSGAPSLGKRFVRSKPLYNLSVDSSCFTLAGLALPVGAPVTDLRIHRSIGYWTGSGLSENLPPKNADASPTSAAGAARAAPPTLADRVAVIENGPSLPEALDAATWILLNTPDGPEVQRAADAILRAHTRDPNLAFLAQELARLRHRSSKALLRALLDDNPNAEVRGVACFSLATVFMDESKHGQDHKTAAEAERLFERARTDFASVKIQGHTLEELAKPELWELRRLTIGRLAPEIDAEDINGQRLKLSDYHGKVVVLVFWDHGYTEAPEHRRLLERMAGKPFALLGVFLHGDLSRARKEIEKYGITWPSFRDSRDDKIAKNWNVSSWPNIWVLDARGVIRYRDLRGRDLEQAVDTLVRE